MGIFDNMSVPQQGFDNGLGFQNYLQSSAGGLSNPAVPGAQNPLTMNWNQLGALGKMGVVSQGLGAFGSLASLYSGFKALKLQEDQFDFTKQAWNKNYNNQVKDYENTLKDRWAARNASAAAGGQSYESMGSWVGSRSLTGEAPGYRAGSAQEFYSGGSAQENKPIRRNGG